MGALDGRTAIITGGASGIGAATVRLFHTEGARVVASDIQDELGEDLARGLGEGVIFHRADVSREEDVERLIGRCTDEWDRLDCIFLNAGYGGVRGPIETTAMDEYDATLGVLLRGVVMGMKHAAPVMKAQGSGSIICTGSVAGLQGGLGPHVYSAAKAAVVHLTRSVGIELGPSGVRVNCICPGGIVTPLITREFGGGPSAVQGVTELFSKMQPIRRAGLPEDIARAALWLASDASSFVNAQAIVVDGGLTAGRQDSGTFDAPA